MILKIDVLDQNNEIMKVITTSANTDSDTELTMQNA